VTDCVVFATPSLFQRQIFLIILKQVKADATTFFHLVAFAQMPTKRSIQQDMMVMPDQCPEIFVNNENLNPAKN
jgi:hypothetical protein